MAFYISAIINWGEKFDSSIIPLKNQWNAAELFQHFIDLNLTCLKTYFSVLMGPVGWDSAASNFDDFSLNVNEGPVEE